MGTKRTVGKAKDVRLTIEDVFERFIGEKAALNKSPATLQTYRGTFNRFHKHLKSNGMDENIASVSVEYLQSFSKTLLEEQLRPASINHYMRGLLCFLYWAMEHRYVSAYKIRLLAEPESIKPTYDKVDVRKLIVKPARTDSFVCWRAWAIVNWIMSTGNRAETVCNVRLGDVNFSTTEIVLRHTKNKRAQIIPLGRKLL